MLLAELVATAEFVASTSLRSNKIALIAGFLERLEAGEVLAAVGFLSGNPSQGKIGVGWALLSAIEVPPAPQASLQIGDFDRVLGQIESTIGTGSAGARTRLLTDLLGSATAPEANFIRRLLVGELRQGALSGLMSEAVAKAAGVTAAAVRRAVMLAGDLSEVARVALTLGIDGLNEIGLVVLRPIQPMLASTAENLEEALLATGPAAVEWKLDGIRIQVHRSGAEVRVFTRNLNDITAGVPEIVAVARQIPADQFVFDGEAIGVPRFFDCLHHDGRDLLDEPLRRRLKALDGLAARWRIPSIVTSDLREAERVLDESLAAGHEGVMVKAADSLYQAGRRGKAWKKVKRALTLDLVVLGAEWGHGRRTGWLSNLHLGARDPAGGFVMVGKTFKGLTDEVLRWQTQRFLELESERKGITVFIRPEVVVEVELDGVQVSPRYPGGVALRFARVKRYRPDKTPAEADQIATVRGLLGGTRSAGGTA